jgi:aminoglycoside phosphotransferase (APT) family kinase protein
MALKNLIDPTSAGRRLEEWYTERHPDFSNVRVTDIQVSSSNGMSTETVLFDLTWTEGGVVHDQGFVARVTPTSAGMFPAYDLIKEQKVMNAVARSTRVPVPTAYQVERDTTVLGSPFLLMQRLSGRVPSDDPPFTASGWVTELPAERQAAMLDNALISMAGIHRADISGLGSELVGHPSRGDSPLGQQLTYYEDLYVWSAAGRPHPVLDAGIEWVREHRPAAESPAGLSWGDARLGNMMFGADLAVTGVLDWEMATIGEAELDLAWFLFLNQNHSEGLGLPAPPGFPSREQAVARYEQLLGRRLVNFGYHEVFAAVRASIVMMRVGTMMIELGILPADAQMPVRNSASRLLARVLQLPDRTEEASWISRSR